MLWVPFPNNVLSNLSCSSIYPAICIAQCCRAERAAHRLRFDSGGDQRAKPRLDKLLDILRCSVELAGAAQLKVGGSGNGSKASCHASHLTKEIAPPLPACHMGTWPRA